MPHETVEPVLTPGSHGDVKSTHPAFGAITAHRVSGHANLFDSSMAHSGYVVVETYLRQRFEQLSGVRRQLLVV